MRIKTHKPAYEIKNNQIKEKRKNPHKMTPELWYNKDKMEFWDFKPPNFIPVL